MFTPFENDSDYFAVDKRFMLNLRVDDLAGMLASLKAAGIPVITKAEWDASPDRQVRPHPRSGGQPDRAVGAARPAWLTRPDGDSAER